MGSSVLMLHNISRKVGDTNITRIVPNVNLLIYLTSQKPISRNMSVEHNLNHIIFKFVNSFKETAVSRIIIGKNGRFQLMGAP